MNIEIDFEVLSQTEMSADDFVYLYIIYRKGYNYLDDLNLKPNLDELQEKGYIKLGNTPDQHEIKQIFIDLFASDFDQMFAELVNMYPMKVGSPGRGIRILHAKDPNAKAEKILNQLAKSFGDIPLNKVVNDTTYKHQAITAILFGMMNENAS